MSKIISLKDCPFCGFNTIWEEVRYTYRPNQFICGCETVRCRGWYQIC